MGVDGSCTVYARMKNEEDAKKLEEELRRLTAPVPKEELRKQYRKSLEQMDLPPEMLEDLVAKMPEPWPDRTEITRDGDVVKFHDGDDRNLHFKHATLSKLFGREKFKAPYGEEYKGWRENYEELSRRGVVVEVWASYDTDDDESGHFVYVDGRLVKYVMDPFDLEYSVKLEKEKPGYDPRKAKYTLVRSAIGEEFKNEGKMTV